MASDEGNPIDRIEATQAMMDLGETGYHVLRGALEGGATPTEAGAVVRGYFWALMQPKQDSPQTEDED